VPTIRCTSSAVSPRAIHLHVAVRADKQHTRTGRVTGDVRQHVQRAAVGVVQVLQHDDQRLHVRRVAQERRHRLHQPVALLVGVARRRRLDVDALAHLRDDAGHLCRPGPQVAPQFVRLGRQHVRAHRLHEG
jgi:hypothetical protein